MKVSASKAVDFNPVHLTITMESAEEADGIYQVFNLVGICEFLRTKNIEADDIRNVLNKQGIESFSVAEVSEALEKHYQQEKLYRK